MKAYMGFSIGAGAREGAILIFAHTAREAKKVGYPHLNDWVEEFIDFGVRLIKDADWLFLEADQNKLADHISHVIEPKYCNQCGMWGHAVIRNGLCTDCITEVAAATSSK